MSKQLVPCLLALVLGVPPAPVQDQAKELGGLAFYEAVIDRLFAPRTEPKSNAVYTIRYVFGEKTEFQIRASELWDPSGYHVGRWRVRRGAPSLYQQVDRLIDKQPVTSVERAASSLSVEYDEVTLPSTGPPADLLRRGQSFTIPAVALSTIELHGTEIRFSVRSPGRDLDVRVWGPGLMDTDKDPFVRWLIDLRATFETLDFASLRR